MVQNLGAWGGNEESQREGGITLKAWKKWNNIKTLSITFDYQRKPGRHSGAWEDGPFFSAMVFSFDLVALPISP